MSRSCLVFPGYIGGGGNEPNKIIMTIKDIESVFSDKTDALVDPDCEHCDGTGWVAEPLEGQNLPCLCITERKVEIEVDTQLD